MSGATPYICLIELYERNRATALKKHWRFFQKEAYGPVLLHTTHPVYHIPPVLNRGKLVVFCTSYLFFSLWRTGEKCRRTFDFRLFLATDAVYVRLAAINSIHMGRPLRFAPQHFFADPQGDKAQPQPDGGPQQGVSILSAG